MNTRILSMLGLFVAMSGPAFANSPSPVLTGTQANGPGCPPGISPLVHQVVGANVITQFPAMMAVRTGYNDPLGETRSSCFVTYRIVGKYSSHSPSRASEDADGFGWW